MKNKYLPFVVLTLMLLVVPAISHKTVFATAEKSDPWVTGINCYIEGYVPASGSGDSMNYVSNEGLAVSMTIDSFYELDIAPEQFATTGITRTYSDSIAAKITDLDSTRGIYQTLLGIPETDFSQIDNDRETTVYTFTTTKIFAEEAEDAAQDYDADYTYANFTVNKMYVTFQFDRDVVDSFFTDAKNRAPYSDIAEDLSTSSSAVITLLDEVFGDSLFDVVYAPVNVTDYSSTWSVKQEFRSVLGGNETDDSVDDTVKIVSLRNALVGYLGQNVVADSVVDVPTAAAYEHPELPDSVGPFFGFTATDSAYYLNFDIKTDFANSPLLGNYTCGFALFQVGAEKVPGLIIAFSWYMTLGIGLGAGAGLAVITALVTKNKKKLKSRVIIAFVSGTVIAFLIAFALTVSVSVG